MFNASEEMALSFVCFNVDPLAPANYTGGIGADLGREPVFLQDDGVHRLARASARFTDMLESYEGGASADEVFERLSGGAHVFDPIEWVAAVVSDRDVHVFATRQISTIAKWASWSLRNRFGYAFRNGYDETELCGASFWELAGSGEAKAVAERLQARFSHPSFGRLTNHRLEELCLAGCRLVEESRDVPFGSLAQTISRKLNIAIILSPFRGASRAVRWQVKQPNGGLQEFIFYAPSPFGRSVFDLRTRYAVAHELAHIVLGHRPHRDQHGDASQQATVQRYEAEADALAAAFMMYHGTPAVWETPSRVRLFELFSESHVSPRELHVVFTRANGDCEDAVSDWACDQVRIEGIVSAVGRMLEDAAHAELVRRHLGLGA